MVKAWDCVVCDTVTLSRGRLTKTPGDGVGCSFLKEIYETQMDEMAHWHCCLLRCDPGDPSRTDESSDRSLSGNRRETADRSGRAGNLRSLLQRLPFTPHRLALVQQHRAGLMACHS